MADKETCIFQEIHGQIAKGPLVKRIRNCPDFPRLVDVELTNSCNLHCLMCPSGAGSTSRTKGYMDCRTIEKLLTELSERRTAVRLIRWGEPMLHPAFFQFLNTCKESRIPIHFNTNGLFLSPSSIDMLIVNEVDSIKISMQGGDRQSYFKWRGVDFYNQLLNDVKLLVVHRGTRKKPFIHVGTTISGKETDACFRKDFGNVADLITVGETLDLSQDREPTDCPEMWDKLSVDWDGTVSACCGDYDNFMKVGMFPDQSLEEIWTLSDKLQEFRDQFANGDYAKMTLCRKCARGI